jgi:hypothetical protein
MPAWYLEFAYKAKIVSPNLALPTSMIIVGSNYIGEFAARSADLGMERQNIAPHYEIDFPNAIIMSLLSIGQINNNIEDYFSYLYKGGCHLDYFLAHVGDRQEWERIKGSPHELLVTDAYTAYQYPSYNPKIQTNQ